MAEEREPIETDVEEQKEEVVKEKKKRGGLGCLIALLVILVTPILVAFGMYYLSRDFQLFSNQILSYLPGSWGEHFASKPSRLDEMRSVKEAADFLVKLENARIIDKLKLIEAKDARFYDELIKELFRLNPNKIRIVLDEMRRTGKEKDLLSEIKGDVEAEELEKTKKFAEYLSSLPLKDSLDEISKITVEFGGHERLASYLENMDEMKAMRIIYSLDNHTRNQVFSLLSEDKARRIKDLYKAEQRKYEGLEQLAILMKREKGANIAAELLKLPEEDQVYLLRKLGPRVAGLALFHINDNEKALDLIAKIKRKEMEDKGTDELTKDLINALKIYRDYDDNIKELVDIYLKMETGKVVQIVKDMMINPAAERTFRFDNGDVIEFTDMDLIVDIFRRFPEKKVAEIMSKLDDTLTSELTRRLAIP